MDFLKSLFRVMLWLAALGGGAGLLAGSLPGLHPAADSFAHFRVHFAAVLAGALLLLALFGGTGWRRWLLLAAAAVIALALRGLWTAGPPETAAHSDLRVMQFNLSFRNGRMAEVMALVAETAPDFVTMQEVTPASEAFFDRAAATHPFRRVCAFARVGAVAILSKHPFAEGQGGCSEKLGLTWAVAETPKGAVTVASLHLHWPWPFGQHAQIDALEPWLSALKTPLVLGGDFNAAPWSHAVARVARASRTQPVPGLRFSIGVRVVRWLPGVPIPIDHVLLSEEFCGLAARVGPRTGSDHYPIIVDIGRVDPTASTGCPQLR